MNRPPAGPGDAVGADVEPAGPLRPRQQPRRRHSTLAYLSQAEFERTQNPDNR